MRNDWRCKLVMLLCLTACDDAGNQISGVVTMKPELMGRVKESDTLFITARPAGATGGPPLAVVRIVGASFPARFEMSQSDVVSSGQWFRGKLQLKAAFKRSGFIGVDTSDDLEGQVSPNPVTVGDQSVTIELVPIGRTKP